MDIFIDVHCTTCRYNLRGLALDRDCPECGSAIQNSISHDDRFKVAAALAGLPLDGVTFIHAAVSYQVINPDEHFDARIACLAVRDFAVEFLQHRAREELMNYGLVNSEAIGRAMFSMVRCGLLRGSENDKESDFDGLFTLDTLLACPDRSLMP